MEVDRIAEGPLTACALCAIMPDQNTVEDNPEQISDIVAVDLSGLMSVLLRLAKILRRSNWDAR